MSRAGGEPPALFVAPLTAAAGGWYAPGMSTTGLPKLTDAAVRPGRLELKAGRLAIDLDALACTGTILLDGTRFPVTEMTLRIVAGRPLECEAKFWVDDLPEEGPATPLGLALRKPSGDVQPVPV